MDRQGWNARIGTMLSVVVTLFACGYGPNDPEEEMLDELELRTAGGMWIGNGLEDPDVSGVDPAGRLSSDQGLDPNGALMSTSTGIVVATYLVECALAANQSVTKTRQADGQTFVLSGRVGLAPQWLAGGCDESCQQWVSACLLARTNVTGQTVKLWISADHPAVGLGDHGNYSLYEATFYGNVFRAAGARYLCRGSDADDSLGSRTCGSLPTGACGFIEWGDCDDPGRCIDVDGYDTRCADGSGVRYASISTFLVSD